MNNLDPNLIAALIWLESGGDPVIISRDGAVGLMQVMPSDGQAATFLCVNGPCFANRPSTTELKNPEFNVAWGTEYLGTLLQNLGNMRDALRSYGPANVEYRYADAVLAIFKSY
jgi:soluble lytic murein transglycosylase-like protein